MSNVVGLPTPPKVKEKAKFPVKAILSFILVMFILGISIGACSLGMKLPVALYELAVGQK